MISYKFKALNGQIINSIWNGTHEELVNSFRGSITPIVSIEWKRYPSQYRVLPKEEIIGKTIKAISRVEDNKIQLTCEDGSCFTIEATNEPLTMIGRRYGF